MRTIEDVGRYLTLTGEVFDEVAPGTWILKLGPAGLQLAVRWEPPVVVFRMNVMRIPAARREEFYATLLRWNASEVVHGSYGIDGDDVIMDCALQVENLDFNEFQAAVESIELSVMQHLPRLAGFAK